MLFALLAAPLLAEPASVFRIRLEGAEKLLELAKQDVAAVEQLHENGAATKAEVDEAMRALLDAQLALVDAKLVAKPDVAEYTRVRRELLQRVELLEARRYAAAQALRAKGALDLPGLLRRRVAHQFAWIERNHADQLADAPSKARLLAAERDWNRAKVRLQAAKELHGYREKLAQAGQSTAASVRASRRSVIRSETALAVAKELLRLAEK